MSSDILKKIVTSKREEVAQAKSKRSLEKLQQDAQNCPKPRDFFKALTTPPNKLRVIAEVKKASPSAGLIRSDFDPVKIATSYYENGAAAISCLTDKKYFQGELSFVKQIKEAIPLPVLRKDFIVDEYQIYESLIGGADCILLIAECLEKSKLIELFNLALKLNLTVLVETHDPDNLIQIKENIDFSSSKNILLGINNRDLRTMKTDIAHTLNLIPKLDNTDRLVSESGLRTNEDIQTLAKAGVHRVLVGEHLMKQDDPGQALAKLMGS